MIEIASTEKLGIKFQYQMGFEPTTPRDLAACSNWSEQQETTHCNILSTL